MKVKTLGDAVKQVKKLLSTLGIDYWHVFIAGSRYFDKNPNYTENSKIEPVCGDHYKIETVLTVSDTIELFIENEDYLFVVE